MGSIFPEADSMCAPHQQADQAPPPLADPVSAHGSILCQIRLCERCSGSLWGKKDSASLCIKCFNNFKWKQQAGTLCGVHSCSIRGVNKMHRDYISLCRAAGNRQHSQWYSLSQVQMLLSWQGWKQMLPPAPLTGNSALTSPLAGHTTAVLPLGRDVRPAAAQDVFGYLAQLQRGCCCQGRALTCPAEQKSGELQPSMCPTQQTSSVLALTSRLLPSLKTIVGDWGFFAECEGRKVVFKLYSNGEVLRH